MLNCSEVFTVSWTKITQQPFRLESKSNNVVASVCLQSFKDSCFMMGAKLIHSIIIIIIIIFILCSLRLLIIKSVWSLDATINHCHSFMCLLRYFTFHPVLLWEFVSMLTVILVFPFFFNSQYIFPPHIETRPHSLVLRSAQSVPPSTRKSEFELSFVGYNEPVIVAIIHMLM